ncbi:hypothetical protein GSI_05780 [Ganoderma sinense ZZ0214-1]|uniref:Uncharacterized protein n=1 Tax=Ganoderma sinense ZZ0214-1 TaxID=1077348 RepID=A0A2G8SBE1_9APHY|nr:hypothetical protein GSI_05780 [Ganoderma sinense ZZ0214-1]
MLLGQNRLEDLDGLFALGTVDQLTHLVLFVEMKFILDGGQTGELDNFSRDQLLDTLVGTIKELRRLTHLRIVFHHYIDQWESDSDLESESESESDSSESEADRDASPSRSDEELAQVVVSQDVDLYPTAVRFIDAVQTLQCFLMTTCGIRDRSRYPREYWHSSKAWRVIALDVDKDRRPPGTKQASSSWVEIGSGDVEVIIDQEELHVHNREKASNLCSCPDSS